jgi:hypothetical protein
VFEWLQSRSKPYISHFWIPSNKRVRTKRRCISVSPEAAVEIRDARRRACREKRVQWVTLRRRGGSCDGWPSKQETYSGIPTDPGTNFNVFNGVRHERYEWIDLIPARYARAEGGLRMEGIGSIVQSLVLSRHSQNRDNYSGGSPFNGEILSVIDVIRVGRGRPCERLAFKKRSSGLYQRPQFNHVPQSLQNADVVGAHSSPWNSDRNRAEALKKSRLNTR